MVLVRVHVTRRRERAAWVRVDELRDSASFHGRQVIIGRQVGDGAVEQPPAARAAHGKGVAIRLEEPW